MELSLIKLKIGEQSVIKRFDLSLLTKGGDEFKNELLEKFIEMGIVEKNKIIVLNKGLFNSPIAIRINNLNNKIVLRKSEAKIILVERL